MCQICARLEVSSVATVNKPLMSGSQAIPTMLDHCWAVIGLSAPVSTFTAKMCGKLSVPFCPTQAINFPSGDHDGMIAVQ